MEAVWLSVVLKFLYIRQLFVQLELHLLRTFFNTSSESGVHGGPLLVCLSVCLHVKLFYRNERTADMLVSLLFILQELM
ncbi:UNVERIFIED_CONTAM: hypothetical protein FKN15_054703 [Acipenser sinensis]